ncbi:MULTISPECIES: transposase [Xanthomonas]|uniref:transposase n=1 Tax=Xanthomonas TaxID=338 RepID=UPI001F369EF9|nr:MULTISPECIES: transposase [Xanthomonas]UZB01728.1 transposase [Xanthomonas citri pv. fuscans]UZB06095.1 transposase [Xanthomonas citri pv. fuscans]UZB10172.1 transposase [Xanthomonas citri pv. fuscans]
MRYLHLMHEALHATGCQLHTYVLMDNHVHLLVTPPAAGRIGQVMQRLGRNYVALFNGRHGRTGTLWEGRYKACLVDTADYVLRCYRYIELNPLRARLTDNPAAYRWSSCPANLGQRRYSALTHIPVGLRLAATRSSDPTRTVLCSMKPLRRTARQHSSSSTAAARPGPRHLLRDDRSQDPALCERHARASATQAERRRLISEPETPLFS